MNFFFGSNRKSYLAAYALVCAAAAAVAAAGLQRLAPEFWLTAVYMQLLLLYITGVCLMPATRGSITVLTRGAAIGIVLASGAINLGCFTFLYLGSGLRDTTGLSNSISFRDGLYFSLVTFTTLGFGDLQPFPQGRLAASFQALSGYLYLGLGIGLAVNGFRTAFGDDGCQNTSK